MNLIIDFHRDWIEIVSQEITALGYTIPPGTTERNIATIYFNVLRRMVPAQKRVVHTSKEFVCPAEVQSSLEALRIKIRNGDDVNPHLSRKLPSPVYNDPMLNDWGIQHLHLGEVLQPNGMIKGTRLVLFALFTSSAAYEIQIYDHGNWSNRDVIEIVHNNWPQLIRRASDPTMLDLSHNPTSEGIAQLREVHVNSLLKTKDGTVYTPIGGGVATDGTSMIVVLQVNQHVRWLSTAEELFRSEIDKVIPKLTALGYSEGQDLTFRFDHDSTGAWANCVEYPLKVKLK
jgi:hypothetical protein